MFYTTERELLRTQSRRTGHQCRLLALLDPTHLISPAQAQLTHLSVDCQSSQAARPAAV